MLKKQVLPFDVAQGFGLLPQAKAARNDKALLLQFETRQFAINRAPARQLALIQKKLASGHCTEVGHGPRPQLLLQASELAMGFFAGYALWFRGAAAGERQVRAIGARF